MRRSPWILIALLLLGLWAWSQHRDATVAADAPPPARAIDGHRHAPPVGVEAAGSTVDDDPRHGTQRVLPSWLPPEARDTLRLVASGGPYPHRQDGSTFQNREGRLPARPRGDYREYTVVTPGARDRGARRIITLGDPPTAFFYTDDHYRSFRRIPATAVSP